MPRYTYRCRSCDAFFQATHSIKERLTDCEECQVSNSLQRVPSVPFIMNKKEGNQEHQPGTLVKEYIEEATEALKEERKELTNQAYKDD
jgi:putative FmdB family regulatory protein